MIWVLAVCTLVVLAFWLSRPIKNEFGTFGDEDYDYEGEIKARGWDTFGKKS